MSKIGLIGGGNMGEAILAGIYKEHQTFVNELSFTRRSYLKSKYKCRCGDLEFVLASSQIIILAVKPQNFEELLEKVAEYDVSKKLFISIAAGITTHFIEETLEQHVRVIRTMPNMPAIIGKGITGIAKGRYATSADVKKAESVMSAVGQTLVVKEDQIDAITAISGSGPAYVFYFVESMISAGKKLGLRSSQAKELAYATVMGSAEQLLQSKDDVGKLREKVTSKGGTTAAALDVFQKKGFERIIKEATRAAAKRAKQLSK